MNAQEIEELKTNFRRCRPGTVEAIVRFRETGDTEALQQAVVGIIERYVPPGSTGPLEKAEPTARLIEDLGIDSLTMLEVVMALEDALQIKVENEELRTIRTLGDVNAYLVRKKDNPHQSIVSAPAPVGKRSFSRADLAALLPQQDPFLFLDAAEIDGKSVRATFTPQTGTEYFRGHFKNNPVLPASILFESMGQAGCLWLLASHPPATGGSEVLFTSITGAHCHRKVKPGELLSLHLHLKSIHAPLAAFQGTVTTGDETVAVVEEVVLAWTPAAAV